MNFKILTIGWSLIILFLTLTPDTGGEKFWLLEFKGMDKAAHFGLFFVLSILVYPAFQATKFNPKRLILISVIYGILLSLLTEFGQQYVQGRTSDVADFIADAIGVVLGLTLAKFVLFKNLKN